MKNRLNLLCLILLIALLTACGNKESETSKKEVVAAQVGAPKSLDPQGTNDKRSLEVIVQI
ncbi:MAG: hypothetical protein ACRC51_05370, partial [Cetobacterium sp.]